jgi:hypothetical protein
VTFSIARTCKSHARAPDLHHIITFFPPLSGLLLVEDNNIRYVRRLPHHCYQQSLFFFLLQNFGFSISIVPIDIREKVSLKTRRQTMIPIGTGEI